MFKNYFKIAWRNLMKNKVFSLINILGLTIGITVCMMIFLFIMNEFSVDKFQQNGNNIYRVMRSYDATKEPVPYLSGPYAPALLNDFSADIKKAVRVMPSNDLFVVGNRSFNEKKVYITDSNFFSLFSFPLVRGNVENALKDPHSIVLTETTAKKYFGSVDNAMNKVMEMDKNLQLKVTAIAKDVPSNSHMDFDMVLPIETFTHNNGFNVWINNSMFVYVLLNEHTNIAQLEKKFAPFMEKYMGDDMKQYGMHFSLLLRPLKDVYFEQSSAFDNVRHGDKTVVYIFLSIAVLILLIACINFMNLSTIRAVERSKEVGLRKVLGALRNHLVWQFIGESVLLATVSCAFSLGLLELLMPWYNQLLGYSLTVSWNALPIYLFLFGTIIIVGFLAGSYPAFFLSTFSPIQALKGKLRLGKGGSAFRQVLVVIQFSISVFLIVCTIVIFRQMNYVRNRHLGYDQSQTAVIRIDNNDIYDNRNVFKHELESNSNIQSVSLMSGEPGGFFDQFGFDVEGQHAVWNARTEFADFQFVKTLGLKIIAGRNFSPQYTTDTTNSVLINKTAATKL